MTAPFTVEQVDKARVSRRRATFFSLIFLLTTLAAWFMADLLWDNGVTGIEVAVLVLFAVLFAHIAVGFCTALVGFYVINRGGDSSRITATLSPDEEPPLYADFSVDVGLELNRNLEVAMAIPFLEDLGEIGEQTASGAFFAHAVRHVQIAHSDREG